MKVYNELELIGRGYKYIGNYLEEDELKEGREYVIQGAGILQKGWCDRDLKSPSGYDKWFDSEEEAEKYITDLCRLGYGNTVHGPFPLFIEVKPIG